MAIELKRPNEAIVAFGIGRITGLYRKQILEYIAALELTLNPIAPDVVRLRRTELDMTQAELAQLVGVGTPHISKIERGKDKPSPMLQAKLLCALGLDAQTIVTRTQPRVIDR